MTGRERLLKTFRGENVDRVPICPWLYKNLVYRYFDIPPDKQKWRENDKLAEKELEVSDYFGFDHLLRLGTPWHVYDEKSLNNGKWEVEIEFKRVNGRDTEITTIKTPEKKLRQVKKFDQTSNYTYVEAIREHYIKDKDDFNQFIKYQPSFEDAIYLEIKEEFKNLGKSKKVLGDNGVVVSCAHGAFNCLNMYRNLELIMMDPYTDLGFYKAMIEYFSNRSFEIFKKMVNHGADIIEIAANLATSGVGEKFFKNYVLEYEKNLIEKIHSIGAFDIYHNCGDADKIMHLYNNIGTNAWGYLTPPPYGDVDLDKALKVIDKNIVLIGNIDQVNFMVKASAREIKEKVKNLLEKVKQRGNFILSTTDWFFDDTPLENIKAFTEAGFEFGKY
ncbi:MAG: uroporphyrinogen decarboxylase family protein [Candidatus Humimicrobiaceae bacterium]